MERHQRQIQTGYKRKNSITNQQHFYFFISEIRFFQFDSLIITILLFCVWNLPLLRMLQMFIINNPKVTDIYLIAMFNVSKFLFSIEQYVVLNFIDSNFQNSNLLNLIFFIILALYSIYLLAIYRKFKKTLKISQLELTIFRIYTFIIYFICFYIYIISWTALIKGIRGNAYKYLPFALFNIIVTFAIIFMIEFFFNQNQYLSKKSLSKLNYQINTAVHLAKLILAGCIAFRDYFPNKNNFLCIYMSAYNIILICQFKIILANVAYINQRTQKIYQLFTINTFVTYLTITIYYLTKNYTVINNTIFILITVNGLALWTLALYKQNRKECLFQGQMPDSHNESELAWRMLEYVKLLKNQSNEKLSFSSLSIIKHLKQCRDLQCFCSQYSQKNGSELINNKQFMLKFIISKLNQLKDQNSKSFYLKMISINFKLIFLQSFTEIYSDFQKINTSNIDMNETLKGFFIYQYKKEFQLKVQEITNQSNQIKLKQLFQEENFREDLIQQLYNISNKNVKKYTLLSQDFCNLNYVFQIGNIITNIIKKIQTRWFMFKGSETYNMRILQVFLIYFEFILPIRTQTSQIKAMINKRLHTFRFLKGVDEATINKAIYTQRSGVFQTVFNNYDDIRILNVSPYCAGLLQMDKREVIGKEIHEIMPNYLSNTHKQLIAQKLSSLHTLKHLDHIRDAYFVDFKGHCFSGKIHTKISSMGNEVIFYMLLLKDDENNFIVVDDNLIIQGIGKRVQRQQIFYKENIYTRFSEYCKQDIKSLLQYKSSIKKSIHVAQLTKKIDTKSLIKYNNLQTLDEDQLKNYFDTINYECQTQISKHRIKNTQYYTIKFGQVKKAFKCIEGKKNLDEWRKVSKKIGTIIMTQAPNSKKIESVTLLTEMQIQNKSDVFALGGVVEGDNMLGMNETSSTASSYKDNINLSYTQLMVKLKKYLISQDETPQFRVPFMKMFMIICGIVIIACGFLEAYIVNLSFQSLASTYEANNFVNNINQILEISLNNQKILQKFCQNGINSDAKRCSYLNNTQNFLNRQLYSMMLNSFTNFLTKQTDMFGVRYYEAFNNIVPVYMAASIIDIPIRQFMKLYYYSLQKVQTSNLSSVEAASNMRFLNDNWRLLKDINDKSVGFYHDRARYEQKAIISIIYSYNVLFLIVVVAFTLPFHIFLNRCDDKKETIIRLYQLIDIQFCKKLIENEKMIIPMITDGYTERSPLNMDLHAKYLITKRFSQFVYRKNKQQKLCIIFVFLLILALNVSIVATILQYVPVSKDMTSNLQSYVFAQNEAIQNYISLKMEIFSSLSITKRTQTNSSVDFVQQFKNIYSTFTPVDKKFEDRLSSLAIGDICKLNKGFLSQTQMKKCQAHINSHIMQRGIVIATNSLVRQTETYSMQYNQTLSTDYLSNSQFQGLDDQLVFNMYVYQLIKAEIITSLGRTLSTFTSGILVFNYIQLAFVIAAVYAATIVLSKKRANLRNLFGIILQIPQKIFVESKMVMRIITQTLIQK